MTRSASSDVDDVACREWVRHRGLMGVVVGAPSRAGAYAPGQEQTPQVLRSAGLLDKLRARGIEVDDLGDTDHVRWRSDRDYPYAMNAGAVARAATQIAHRVRDGLAVEGSAVLVLGGDCTVELGTVAGDVSSRDRVGLVYIDHDTDLNTPRSTIEGALDWMGVAQLTRAVGCMPAVWPYWAFLWGGF